MVGGIALGLLEQVRLKKKKNHMELYQVHLETVGNEPGGTFSFNPLDIQLWTWIRPLNSWVRRTLTPCHSFKLFIPSSPSNKSTRDCPPLTRHTHTHTHVQLPDMPVLFQRTLDSESRQVTMVLWLLLCPAHQGMEISVHMFLKALWERSVGLHGGTQWQALSQRKDLGWQAAAVLLDTEFVCKGSGGKPCAGLQSILTGKSRAFRVIKSHPEDIR